MLAEGLQQRLEARFAAQFRRQRLIINHVITMGRPWSSAKNRRGIEVADTECRKIRHQLGRPLERHAVAELDAIGGVEPRHDARGLSAAIASVTARKSG